MHVVQQYELTQVLLSINHFQHFLDLNEAEALVMTCLGCYQPHINGFVFQLIQVDKFRHVWNVLPTLTY